MATYNFILDTEKKVFEPERAFARCGDNLSTTIVAIIEEAGEPFSFKSTDEVVFECIVPTGKVVKDPVEKPQNSVVTYSLPSHVLQAVGTINCAYFRIMRADKVIASTDTFAIVVQPSIDSALDNIDLGPYMNEWNKMIERYKEQIAGQQTAFEEAEEARQRVFESNEQSRVAAETARVTAEADRVTAEQSRVAAETARVTAEADRVTAEQSRVAAETARVTAEADRVTAEQSRVSQQTSNNASQAANDLQQKKNNADQIANNAAAVGIQWVRLTEDKYDGDGVPNFVGEWGKMYLVPDPSGSEDNSYYEWIYFPEEEGSAGFWEKVGIAPGVSESLSTDQIDKVLAGENLASTSTLDGTGLAYYTEGLKQKIEASGVKFIELLDSQIGVDGVPLIEGQEGKFYFKGSNHRLDLNRLAKGFLWDNDYVKSYDVKTGEVVFATGLSGSNNNYSGCTFSELGLKSGDKLVIKGSGSTRAVGLAIRRLSVVNANKITSWFVFGRDSRSSSSLNNAGVAPHILSEQGFEYTVEYETDILTFVSWVGVPGNQEVKANLEVDLPRSPGVVWVYLSGSWFLLTDEDLSAGVVFTEIALSDISGGLPSIAGEEGRFYYSLGENESATEEVSSNFRVFTVIGGKWVDLLGSSVEFATTEEVLAVLNERVK